MKNSKREIINPQTRPAKKHHPAKIWVLSIVPIILVTLPNLLFDQGVDIYSLAFRPIHSLLVGIIALLISVWIIGIWRGILVFVVMLICFSITEPLITWATPKALEAEVKANNSSFRNALEKYAEDYNGLYPEHTNVLIDEGYFNIIPDNPIAGGIMMQVDFGAEPFEGNFTYIPVYESDNVIGYYILGNGYKHRKGMDLDGDGIDDHVIIVFDSNGLISMSDRYGNVRVSGEPDDDAIDLPPLEELLRE